MVSDEGLYRLSVQIRYILSDIVHSPDPENVLVDISAQKGVGAGNILTTDIIHLAKQKCFITQTEERKFSRLFCTALQKLLTK